MKHLFALLLALSLGLPLAAQSFTVPQNVEYETEDDFFAQQDNVVAAVDWLIATPLGEQTAKREAVGAFLVTWATETPTFTVKLDQDLAPFTDCGDCLVLFMGAYAKHHIETLSFDAFELNYAAINTVLDFYAAEKTTLGKKQGAEKLLKLREDGKLKQYIKERV